MPDRTAIEWTDATWNPVTGCTKVSPGCAHCYAETLSLRNGTSKKPWTPDNAAENVVLHPDRLDQPLRWRKPRRIFVCSMSDLFHEEIPDEFILEIWLIMAMAPEHIFQVLTKRPERMRELLSRQWMPESLAERHKMFSDDLWPLPNVWLGVSVEDQAAADERIPLLLETPAAVRWISAEPLLGPVELTELVPPILRRDYAPPHEPYAAINALTGYISGMDEYLPDRARLDWLVLGGESGPHWRPMNLDWARTIRKQCRAARVPYFGKQNSGARPGIALPGDLGDREWP